MYSFPLQIDAPENGHIWLKRVGLYGHLLIKKLDVLDGAFEFNLTKKSINQPTTKSNM
jgi:hypothetical protein